MITLEQFRELEPGDSFEMGQPFEGLTREKMQFTVTGVEAGLVRYRVSYLGIRVGAWVCREIHCKLVWEQE